MRPSFAAGQLEGDLAAFILVPFLEVCAIERLNANVLRQRE
jgi:hypothetical protein